MPDRILAAEIAQALQDDSTAEGETLAWIVSGAEGEMLARPVASGRGALAYVLLGETLPAARRTGCATTSRPESPRRRSSKPLELVGFVVMKKPSGAAPVAPYPYR